MRQHGGAPPLDRERQLELCVKIMSNFPKIEYDGPYINGIVEIAKKTFHLLGYFAEDNGNCEALENFKDYYSFKLDDPRLSAEDRSFLRKYINKKIQLYLDTVVTPYV